MSIFIIRFVWNTHHLCDGLWYINVCYFNLLESPVQIDYVVGGRLDLAIHGPERDRLKYIWDINLF